MITTDLWDYLKTFDSSCVPDYNIQTEQEAEELLQMHKDIQESITKAERSTKQYLQAAQRKVDNYIQDVIIPEKEKLANIEEQLREWAEHQIKNTGKKSVKLINGTLSFTKQQDNYEHKDEDIVQWIQSLGKEHILVEFLKEQDPKLDWAGMKKISDTRNGKMYVYGFEIPGVEIEQNLPDKFKVR